MKPTAYTLRNKRFKQWYHWRPYGQYGEVCPRRVMGRKCVRFTSPAVYVEDCICRTGGSSLFDHQALWKDERGNIIFTTEPYTGVSVEDLVKFQCQLIRLGMEATIMPRSGWNPGSTILIAVHEAGQSMGVYGDE